MTKRNSSARTLKFIRIALLLATFFFGMSACGSVHLGQGFAMGEGRITIKNGDPSIVFDLELRFESEASPSENHPAHDLQDNHAARERMFETLSALEGLEEIPGSEHAPLIQEMHAGVGLPNEPDETAWCSSATNWAAENAGIGGTGSAAARSWLTWSSSRPIALSEALPGDVVVFWRDHPASWKGHVGLYVGIGPNAETILVLGGNQGNKVSVAAYPIDRLLGVRRIVRR